MDIGNVLQGCQSLHGMTPEIGDQFVRTATFLIEAVYTNAQNTIDTTYDELNEGNFDNEEQ